MSLATPAVVAASEPQHNISPGFVVAFTPDTSLVADMRRVTAAHLRLWRASDATTDSVIVAVSELVTNGIQHGIGAVTLQASHSDGVLRVQVTDGNPRPAQVGAFDDDALSGRGLFLVAVLAHNWGVSDNGHTTWCDFHLAPGRR